MKIRDNTIFAFFHCDIHQRAQITPVCPFCGVEGSPRQPGADPGGSLGSNESTVFSAPLGVHHAPALLSPGAMMSTNKWARKCPLLPCLCQVPVGGPGFNLAVCPPGLVFSEGLYGRKELRGLISNKNLVLNFETLSSQTKRRNIKGRKVTALGWQMQQLL